MSRELLKYPIDFLGFGVKKIMRKAFRYFAKGLIHFLRYLLIPLFVIASILFLIGTILSLVLSFTKPNVFSIFSISMLFAFMASMFIFIIRTMDEVTRHLSTNKKVNSFFRQHFPKKEAISIKTRLVLKRYLSWLTVAFASLSFGFLSTAFMEELGPFETTYGLIGLMLYVGTAILFAVRNSIYENKEKALYLLQRFSEHIGRYLKDNNAPRPNVKFLEESLKSYQKTLPTLCIIRKIRNRVMQTKLVVERGSKEEIQQLQGFLQQLCISIDEGDPPSFDQHFGDLIRFLEEIQANKQEILELTISSRKERAKDFLRGMVEPTLQRLAPTLIIIVIIIVVYILLGIKIPFM